MQPVTDLATEETSRGASSARWSIASFPLVLRSSLVTLAMVAVLVLWPIALLRRYQEIQASTLDFQLRPEDPALIICGFLWLAMVMTIIGSFRPLRVVPGLADLQTSLRRVNADSYFGLGHYRGWTYTSPDANLGGLEAPDPESIGTIPGWDGTERIATIPKDSASRVVAVVAEPTKPIETKPYVVQRRDSWWAISEAITGEAKHWNLIRDMNLGREVAPDLVIGPDTPLRSGWNIVVPADTSSL